ncbi:TPA: tail fiber assembly protein [Yersinia enterocolitica]|nr:tail fiber assembly protein [Yersinia enterocolitica]HDL7838453.1 tail fiber assembly protein [Yersinia enterocolitica]
MNYIYSAFSNSFYPLSLKELYVSAGTWPTDGIEVSDEIFNQFGQPPTGKVRIAGPDGLPAWADIPPLTAAQLAEIKAINIAQAKADKTKLISDASNKIETLKDRIEAGQDKAAELKLWRSYRIALDDVDVSTAPDIKWPVAPE